MLINLGHSCPTPQKMRWRERSSEIVDPFEICLNHHICPPPLIWGVTESGDQCLPPPRHDPPCPPPSQRPRDGGGGRGGKKMGSFLGSQKGKLKSPPPCPPLPSAVPLSLHPQGDSHKTQNTFLIGERGSNIKGVGRAGVVQNLNLENFIWLKKTGIWFFKLENFSTERENIKKIK